MTNTTCTLQPGATGTSRRAATAVTGGVYATTPASRSIRTAMWLATDHKPVFANHDRWPLHSTS